MKKIYRKLLLFSSSVVFMAIAPLVIFYAMGYRVGIGLGDALPVGVLIIETEPRRAQITIDNKVVGATPRSVSNLPPGEVNISISKDGYVAWLKRLTIEPTIVTYLNSVRLFPAQPKNSIMLNNIDSFSLSPNRQLLAATTPNYKLHVIDEEGSPVISPLPTYIAGQELLWSPDSNRILLITDNTTSVINITDRAPRPRRLPALRQARQITWDPRIPGRLLAVSRAGDLFAYNIATDTTVRLASSVHTFATSSHNIYVVGASTRQIDIYNLQGQLARTLSWPGDQTIDQLLVTPSGHVAVQFNDKSLAVLDEEEKFQPVADNILRAGWSPDGQLLYIQVDETSLHVFNARDERLSYLPPGQLRLVLRLSRSLRSPQWFAGGHHLIYQVDDEIIITEVDTRDHPISYTVASTNLGNSQATVGQNGDIIFYLKRTGVATQLVATSLIVE